MKNQRRDIAVDYMDRHIVFIEQEEDGFVCDFQDGGAVSVINTMAPVSTNVLAMKDEQSFILCCGNNICRLTDDSIYTGTLLNVGNGSNLAGILKGTTIYIASSEYGFTSMSCKTCELSVGDKGER
jgi:hypothetical protein